MGGGGGKSTQTSATTNTTVSDSYNKTINNVKNFSFSDVGNTKIGADALLGGGSNAGGGGSASALASPLSSVNWSTYTPWFVVGGLLIVGAMVWKGGH